MIGIGNRNEKRGVEKKTNGRPPQYKLLWKVERGQGEKVGKRSVHGEDNKQDNELDIFGRSARGTAGAHR